MPVVLLDSGEGGEEKGMVDGREGEGGSLGMGGDPLRDGVKEGNRGVKQVW